MIKKLDLFIIKAFLPPFFITFLVTWFVFIMQFFWLYIDDLVGKGLDTITVIKLVGYLAPTIVPEALPLGVLLAAIMTYGNKSESSELTAIKSSGISLFRFIRPCLIFVIFLSIGAFFYNNYVVPKAFLKFSTLLSDVRNTKPAVNIRAGSFYNEIPGFSIYVGNKGSDNKTINDIIIYDHTSGKGNDKVILAKSGKMYMSNDQKFLIFEMFNGTRYEEKVGKKIEDKEQMRLSFKFWKKYFDLSSFEMQKSNHSFFSDGKEMLNNKRLNNKIDSAYITINNYQKQNTQNIHQYISLIAMDSTSTVATKNYKALKLKGKDTIFKLMTDSLISKVFSQAEMQVKSIKGMTEIYKNDYKIQQLNISGYKIEWHKKITLAAICIILFLIGAPLGAIIRKGGFGAPFVAAVSFFVVYRLLNVSSEKVAESGRISPFFGMWGPPLIFLSFALMLMILSNIDSKIFTASFYTTWFLKIKSKFKR